MDYATHIPHRTCIAKRVALCLALLPVFVGCSTTSNDIGRLPMFYRPLEGLPPWEIAQHTPSDSLDTLTQKLNADSDDPSLLEDRGWLFARSGQYDRAIEDFDSALASGTDLNPQRCARLFCRLGISYYTMGKLTEAIEAYTAAIDIDKENWELYFHRWLALQDAGRTDEAAADKKKGLSLKPGVFELKYSSVGGII
jgi:tetratricopeptide (TPR) repeat protein